MCFRAVADDVDTRFKIAPPGRNAIDLIDFRTGGCYYITTFNADIVGCFHHYVHPAAVTYFLM